MFFMTSVVPVYGEEKAPVDKVNVWSNTVMTNLLTHLVQSFNDSYESGCSSCVGVIRN